jgi:uncharacterized protein YbjT (DUF2867 family)
MRVLVTGATGKQGGAVARQLNQRGHQVVALVRQPDTAPARALAAAGIELSAGDLAGAEALRKAASGAAAIFGISVPFGPGSPGQEVAQGKLLADVASDLGLHLVFSSIRGADRITTSSVAHASSKQLIERYLRDRPVRATVLGPTYFMENALNVGFNRLHQGILAMPLPAGKRLDQTTVLDIAALAVYAFEHPGELAGQRIDLASDSLSGAEMAGTLSQILGRTIPYQQLPIDQVRHWAGSDIATMFERLEANKDYVDITALRRRFPGIHWHDFASWAETVDWQHLLGA